MTKLLADLFFTFAKIGLFTFGGGYAMIPLIQKEAGENKHWINDEELLNVIAIAESTPGPIAINSATFIGRKVAGVKGAACATLGVVLPSFLIIVVISYILEAFESLKIVQYAFWGIRAGVLALILKALWSLFSQCQKDWLAYLIMVAVAVAVVALDINAVLIILVCAIIGIIAMQLGRTVDGDEKREAKK